MAHGVHETGRREILSIDVGEAETEGFGVPPRARQARPGRRPAGHLRRPRPAKAAIAKVLGCSWQRCTVHFLRDCLGHARKDQHGLLAALIRPVFNADSLAQARDRLSEAVAHLDGRLARARRCSRTPRPTSWPSTRSRARTGASCARPTRSSASTRRSAGAPTSLASSPTTARRSASPACSASSKTTNGSSVAPTSQPSRSLSSSPTETITHPTRTRRRCPSSTRPEPPTPSPTSTAPRSYTTSRDLTIPSVLGAIAAHRMA
jgi:putative transposase